MVWYKWQWWRFAWGLGVARWTTDGKGHWSGFGRLYILTHRRYPPMTQKTLYKQAYQRLVERGHCHEDAADIAEDVREAFGNHPATCLRQLDELIECNVEGDPA